MLLFKVNINTINTEQIVGLVAKHHFIHTYIHALFWKLSTLFNENYSRYPFGKKHSSHPAIKFVTASRSGGSGRLIQNRKYMCLIALFILGRILEVIRHISNQYHGFIRSELLRPPL